MDISEIAGTALRLDLAFVWAWEGPPPTGKPLAGPAGALLRAEVEARLAPDRAVALDALLGTPLDRIFDDVWADLRPLIAERLRAQVKRERPSAYGVAPALAARGTLRAGTDERGDVTRLTLGYLVPGVSVTWLEASSAAIGSYLDASCELAFDAELTLHVDVPKDPGAEAGLRTSVEFAAPGARNRGLAADVTQLLRRLFEQQPGDAAASPDLPLTELGHLRSQLDAVSDAVAAAAGLGFTSSGVFIDSAAPDGNTIVFTAEHPFEPGPAAYQVGGAYGPFIPFARLCTEGTRVAPGGSLAVTGSDFPTPSAHTLTVQWDDTTLGPPAQSEVQWGPAADGAAPPFPATIVKFDREGRHDGRNGFTPEATLEPSTAYAFRVRDYSVKNAIATDWGPWVVLRTGESDEVDLVLDDGEGTLVGITTVLPGGAVNTRVTIPADQPPGRYRLWAVADGQRLVAADEPIEVLAAGAGVRAGDCR